MAMAHSKSLPEVVAGFGEGKRAGQHVGRHVAGRQDGVVVERVDQLGIGERGRVDRGAQRRAEHARLVARRAGALHARVRERDLAARMRQAADGAADRIEQQAAALLGHVGRQVFVARGGGEVCKGLDQRGHRGRFGDKFDSVWNNALCIQHANRVNRDSPDEVVAEAMVEIDSGRLKGLRRQDGWAFLGIPYAADTAGEQRFGAPQAPPGWAGEREATALGPRCPQTIENIVELPMFAWYGQDGPFGEDCCGVLDVFTPGLQRDARRPVIVYLHGGGWASGGGGGPALDGGRLAAFGDAVVVTLNHRLNVFGYTPLGPLRRWATSASPTPATRGNSTSSPRCTGYGATSRRSAATQPASP